MTAHTRIVVVTGTVSPVVADLVLGAGADAFLAKPCGIDALVKTVRGVCVSRSPEHSGSPQATSDAGQPAHRVTRSRSFDRRSTSTPPNQPPAASCPECAVPLTYLQSHIGGVNESDPEQWDYFACSRCGPFRYRHRTRRLTPVVDVRSDLAGGR